MNIPQPYLIGFSGKMLAGKTTAAALVADQLGGVMLAFGDPLKQETAELYVMCKSCGAARPKWCFVTSDNIKHPVPSRLVKPPDNLTRVEPCPPTPTCGHCGSNKTVRITPTLRTNHSRALFQYHGTDLRRKIDADYWVKKTEQKLIEHRARGQAVTVGDVRMLSELQMIKQNNGMVVRLTIVKDEQIRRAMQRDGLMPDKAAWQHQSETQLDQHYHLFDLVLPAGIGVESTVKQVLNYVAGDSNTGTSAGTH